MRKIKNSPLRWILLFGVPVAPPPGAAQQSRVRGREASVWPSIFSAPLPLASSMSVAAIFEAAHIDPAPSSYDAETLATLLYRHAETARQRHAAVQACIATEKAAEEAARAESGVLAAEIQQYRSWIAEERQGGGAYRLSKALHEERDRRAALEEQVRSLKSSLSKQSELVKGLVRQATSEQPAARQARVADEVCAALLASTRASLLQVPSQGPPGLVLSLVAEGPRPLTRGPFVF